MYQSESTNTSNPRYVGKRLKIISTVRAQGHCGYPIEGKVLAVTNAVIYDDRQPDNAWVSGYIEGATHPEWDLPVVVGLPVVHTEEVEAQKKTL